MKAIDAANRILEFAPVEIHDCGDDVGRVAAQFLEHLAVVVATLNGRATAELRRAWRRRSFTHRWRVAYQLAQRFCNDFWQAMNDLRPEEDS